MAAGFENWRGAVLKQIRFWPDRERIGRELEDHYEDHRLDLERIGYPGNEAEARALAALGNPEEVGKALNREHSPLLGWLWMASRCLVGLALVLLVYDIFILGGSIFRYRNLLPPQWPRKEPAEFAELAGEPGDGESGAYWHFLSAGVSGAQAETEDYTLAVPQWSMWESEDGKFIRVYLVMTADARRFGSLDDAEFTDDLCFRSPEGAISNSRNRLQGYMGSILVPHAAVSHGGLSQSLTRECFRIEITLRTLPEWVEITYPYGDNDWVLRVELEGAA